MRSPKRILVFQHVAVEHPGIFRQFLADDGCDTVTIELDEGDQIPRLDGFQGLWVMGGPMDVWEEAEHPWLAAEKAAIRDAVLQRELPYLGFCLGHQLLADALGGRVGVAADPEVGVMPVQCTSAGRQEVLFSGLPGEFEVLQWHGAEVLTEPAGAAILASSSRCRNQAMKMGARAYSMQFHVEITTTTVADWNEIPEYAAALHRIFGIDGAQRLIAKAQRAMPRFNANARQIYDNWKAATGFLA